MSEQQFNRKISEMFLSDAKDFLDRYKILKENATHIGLRSKLLIELLFSVECALKSLIYFESEVDEKATYLKIRTHKLSKLVEILSTQSKNEYDKLITTKISHFIVDIRYQLESEIDFRNKYGVLDKKYYDTIANFEWLNNLSIQIAKFVEFIEDKNPFELKIISISDINIEQELENHNKLVKLRK